jgi:hypothetical protein
MNEKQDKNGNMVAAAFLLAIAIGLAGYFAGKGFKEGRAAERFVTVKGVAERDVESDTAIWSLTLVSTNNDLAVAQRQLRDSHAKALDFLKENKIDPASVQTQNFEVIDRQADQWQHGEAASRYILRETLSVRSADPKGILAMSQQVGRLVEAGVIFQSTNGPYQGPTYLFTKLNDLKPQMIAESTKNARAAAEQFAKDSGATIGGIRHANQGVFEILPRNQAPGAMQEGQLEKTVRVVSTVEFYLTD